MTSWLTELGPSNLLSRWIQLQSRVLVDKELQLPANLIHQNLFLHPHKLQLTANESPHLSPFMICKGGCKETILFQFPTGLLTFRKLTTGLRYSLRNGCNCDLGKCYFTIKHLSCTHLVMASWLILEVSKPSLLSQMSSALWHTGLFSSHLWLTHLSGINVELVTVTWSYYRAGVSWIDSTDLKEMRTIVILLHPFTFWTAVHYVETYHWLIDWLID